MSDPTTPDSAVTTALEYSVDDDAERCPHCGRPFRNEHLLWLHRGEQHFDALDDDERETYAEVDDEEDDQLFIFHIKVMAAITLVTFVFIYTYSFIWT